MKVVIDTNVLISSFFWKGVPLKVVELAIARDIEAVSCIEILQEIQQVLEDDFKLSPLKVTEAIKDILSYSDLIKIRKHHIKVRDLEDVKVLDCALTSHAQYIITGDKDLLHLKQVQGVTILKPADFLKILT